MQVPLLFDRGGRVRVVIGEFLDSGDELLVADDFEGSIMEFPAVANGGGFSSGEGFLGGRMSCSLIINKIKKNIKSSTVFCISFWRSGSIGCRVGCYISCCIGCYCIGSGSCKSGFNGDFSLNDVFL